MSDLQFTALQDRLDRIESRLADLEKGLVADKILTRTEKFKKKVNEDLEFINIETGNRGKRNESYFLGFVGAACILAASILLLKLSIDSGWLTPARQIHLAVIFALSIIVIPLSSNFEDKKYISMLPALGVAILHLAIYGSVFFHGLISANMGVLCISIVGIFSLWLLSKLNQEIYAALAIIGTYVGALSFQEAFSQLSLMGLFLIFWDLTFSLFSIILKKRIVISISSYFALGLVAILGILKFSKSPELITSILVLQGIQFAIFATFTLLFSWKTKTSLNRQEAWTFFPVIMFFYGQQYYFFDLISNYYSTAFSACMVIFLIGLYQVAKIKMKHKELESGGVIYTSCSLIFAHSVFFIQANDHIRIILSLLLIIMFTLFKGRIHFNSQFKGSIMVGAALFLYGFLSVLFGNIDVADTSLIFFGILLSMVVAFSSLSVKAQMATIIMYFAHAQMFISLFRLEKYLGNIAIAPLWVTYSFAILYWAIKRLDLEMAQGTIPLFVIALARFLFVDFTSLDGLQRVLALLLMGALIYVGGYLYRKIQISKQHSSST